MSGMLALLAVGGTRTTFEWGRIQSESDWLLPLAVAALVVAFAVFMYRRDSVELPRTAAVLLTLLRVAAVAALLVIYLQPQWRNEKENVTNSRVLLLADTSLSMGLHDNDSSPVPAEPSRAQQVLAALSETRLFDDLRATHDVVLARFDQDLGRVTTLKKLEPADGGADAPTSGRKTQFTWADALVPRGAETRLGQALRQLVNEEHAEPVAGVIVITDGQQNAGIDPAAAVAAAREAAIPVFTIGIGSDRQNTNVRVSDFVAPARAYPGDKYTVTGYLQAQGMAGQTVTVELLASDSAAGERAADEKPGKIEGTQQVTLGDDGEVTPVAFEMVPDAIGRKTLRLRVVPPPRDTYAGDDQQEVDIEIVDRKSRILLFAGGPSREYQFLRNQLRRDKDILVDVLLQTGAEGISQDANEILDEFPTTREALYVYDCIVAFDPNWQELGTQQVEALERWVAEQAGGLIVIAGPIYTDNLAQTQALAKVRDLYPVEFNRRLSALEDSRYGSKEPWPLSFTRDGMDAEFLWIEDSGPSSAQAWADFGGVFGYYGVKGPKPGATVYARFSDPQAQAGGEQPAYMAGQFFGAGRVFYLASGEMWRLRGVDEAYFERFYTKLIRFVSQGRLLRGSNRGVLLVERDRYMLGNTVALRAQVNNAQLEPLVVPQVTLQVYLPDSTQQNVTLLADASRPGNFAGQFTVRKEGVYRLELPVPESADERLTRRIQVKVPDLERERPRRNDALLADIAKKTGGTYYVGFDQALGTGAAPGPLVAQLRDQSRTTIVLGTPDRLWDNRWMMFGVCGLLCTEWLIRRLVKLA
ncbi:MAG: VWA domain-containing protein [Planctomycetia bacterium]|nr:VWA domain-containing protein [Planctomycetia bacterium]